MTTVTITQTDIDYGVHNHCQRCPAALALTRAFPQLTAMPLSISSWVTVMVVGFMTVKHILPHLIIAALEMTKEGNAKPASDFFVLACESIGEQTMEELLAAEKTLNALKG